MAIFTMTQDGNVNDGAQFGNTSPGVAGTDYPDPVGGDNLVVPAGITGNISVDMAFGSNASATGHGVEISGTLTTGDIAVSLQGYDTGSNKAMQINAGGSFQPATNAVIGVLPASSWQTIINNEGDLIANGPTFKSLEPWTFVERGQTLSDYVNNTNEKYDTHYIDFFPIGTTSGGVSKGPISNAAGTGIGSFGDSSFSVVSVTGGTFSPYNILTNEVATYVELGSTGDFWVDYDNGVVYYYQDENKVRLSVQYTVKTHQWLGFGIQSIRNGDSRCLLDNCTFERLGGNWGDHYGEYTEQGLFLRYHTNGVVNAAREGRVKGCTFIHCILPLQIYSSTNTVENPVECTGNTFNYTPLLGGNWRGNVLTGYLTHADLSNNSFDNMSSMTHAVRSSEGILIRNCTGKVFINSILPTYSVGSYAENNNLLGTGNWADGGGFQHPGDVGKLNYYRNNTLRFGNRCGRIKGYMVIEDNEFSQYNHHGFVAPAADGYYADISIKRNIIRDCEKGDMAGGWTLGYNRKQWLDNIEVDHNTFNTGKRSIEFNDNENTIVLGTRLRITNNLLTNTYNGIYRPTDNASNQTKMQIERMDYNNEYGFTAGSNVAQCTAIMGGSPYLSATGNCPGLAVFNPSSIDVVSRALELVIGSSSLQVSWGGGTAVELVDDTGTTTGGDADTLIDTAKSWTTNEHRCKYARVISGAAAGQIYMIYSNTADTLELISNLGSPVSIASGMTYEIIDSEVQLTASDAHTVNLGVHLPTLPTTAATYTDSGITLEYNGLTVDPEYTSATNLTPTNSALDNAGSDGEDIGAYSVTVVDYKISGTVTDGTNPLQRTVRLYNRSDGSLAATTASAVDGTFEFIGLVNGSKYFVVALDDDAGDAYNAIIFDQITPVEV